MSEKPKMCYVSRSELVRLFLALGFRGAKRQWTQSQLKTNAIDLAKRTSREDIPKEFQALHDELVALQGDREYLVLNTKDRESLLDRIARQTCQYTIDQLRGITRNRNRSPNNFRAKVDRALSPEWQSLDQIVEKTGLPREGIRTRLYRATHDGVVDMVRICYYRWRKFPDGKSEAAPEPRKQVGRPRKP